MTISTTNPIHDALWIRVLALFDEWTERLQMHWLHLVLCRSDTRNDEDGCCAADTEAQWEYRQARIRVYLPAIANHTDEDLEAIMVHELVHVLVNPMESLIKEKDTKLSELSVENVAQALLATKSSVVKKTIKKAA